MRQPGWRLHPKKPGGPGKLPAQEDRQAHRVVDSKVLKLKIAEQAGRSGWPQVEVSHCRKAINPGTVLTLLWLCCWEGAVGGLEGGLPLGDLPLPWRLKAGTGELDL